MNAMIPAALALVAFLSLSPAHAEDPAAPAAAAATEMKAEVATEMAAPVEYTLKDGTTKVVVEGEKVFVLGADGAKTAAPDGTHETSTGEKLTTKDGMVVKADAAAEVKKEEKAAH